MSSVTFISIHSGLNAALNIKKSGESVKKIN